MAPFSVGLLLVKCTSLQNCHCSSCTVTELLLIVQHQPGLRGLFTKTAVYLTRAISGILLLRQLCSTFRKSFFHWHVLKSIPTSLSWASCKASHKAQNSSFNYCYYFTSTTVLYGLITHQNVGLLEFKSDLKQCKKQRILISTPVWISTLFCTAVKKLI